MSHDDHEPAAEDSKAIIERLMARDRTIAGLIADTDELEHRLAVWLRPTVRLRRAERDHLHSRVEQLDVAPPAPSSRIAAIEQELAAARFEVAALRQSRSWRVTAPLRWAYRRLVGDARVS